MRWRKARGSATRAKERAGMSFFIFIMFFAVFGVILLTKLMLLEVSNMPEMRVRYDWRQTWESPAEASTPANTPPPPAYAPQDAVWQPVAGTTFKFFVYSAYVERRTVAAVRIIAAAKTRYPDKVICRIWLPNNRTITVPAKVKAIRENWNLKYSASYVLCLLRSSGVHPDETVGASVAVLTATAPNRAPTNLLPVLDTEPAKGIEDKVHVCVKPFHYSYSRDCWLIEWLEMNRLLGVTHFYMYNESLSEKVNCIVDHYVRQGLVTLLPWRLPIINQLEIRTQGMFAAYNDCLYRSMSRAGWLIVIDMDELVLPRVEATLPALLSSLWKSYKAPLKSPAAFLFRNAFFYMRWQDDPNPPSSQLLTSRKTRRWAVPHTLKNRSKFAVRPRDAVELGNHFLWEMVPPALGAGVPPDRALLHHYRMVCEFGGSQCLTVPSVVDTTAHRWARELLQRVNVKMDALHDTCHVDNTTCGR